MFLLVLVILLAIGAWTFGRPRRTFLRAFAKLLDRPEVADGPSDARFARASLTGEFRGRKIVILLQRVRRHFANTMEVSMETRAASTLETATFTGDKVDREGELALFALEVTHELRLSHEDGWLKARWGASRPSLDFPQRFDAPTWQRVLDAMDTLARSLERREARS